MCVFLAPMRICCKKCRPGRNGSAPTNDDGNAEFRVCIKLNHKTWFCSLNIITNDNIE